MCYGESSSFWSWLGLKFPRILGTVPAEFGTPVRTATRLAVEIIGILCLTVASHM